MKIGNLHITWMSARQEEILRIEIREHLRDVDCRQIIAKIARSEVKNYLAECAERAQIPYIDAESLLARLEERAQLLEVEAEALGAISKKMREQFAEDLADSPDYRCSDPDCEDPTHEGWRIPPTSKERM